MWWRGRFWHLSGLQGSQERNHIVWGSTEANHRAVSLGLGKRKLKNGIGRSKV
jgi:hypothetical protein